MIVDIRLFRQIVSLRKQGTMEQKQSLLFMNSDVRLVAQPLIKKVQKCANVITFLINGC